MTNSSDKWFFTISTLIYLDMCIELKVDSFMFLNVELEKGQEEYIDCVSRKKASVDEIVF